MTSYTFPTSPEAPQSIATAPETQYAILNTQTGQFWQFLPTSEVCTDVEMTKDVARQLNAAMAEGHQNFTVVTILFDTEI